MGVKSADQDTVALAVLLSFSLSWLLVDGVSGGMRISDVMMTLRLIFLRYLRGQ